MEPLIIQELFSRRPQAWIQVQNPSKKFLVTRFETFNISPQEKWLPRSIDVEALIKPYKNLTPGAIFDMFYQSPGERSKVRKYIRKHFNLRLNTILQLVIREDDHFGNTVNGL
jgi:hypothetical protein